MTQGTLQLAPTEEELRTWAASNHDNGGHDTKRCPACQVLKILEAHS